MKKNLKDKKSLNIAINWMKKDKSPEEQYKERQKQSRPVADALFGWLHSMEDSVDRSSLIGDAVLYTLNQEEYLKRYLEDGHGYTNFIKNIV